MRESLQQRCELFIKNRDKIKQEFTWDNAYMYPLCASIFAEKGIEVDVQKMKECQAIIKNSTGLFSSFRGIGKLALLSQLAISNSPEEKFKNTLQVFHELKKKFHSSNYLPVTAMALAELVNPEDYATVVNRTRELYELMRKEHPFLTSGEDCTLAALLALKEEDNRVLLRKMESCYEQLGAEFGPGDGRQSLSHVITLGSEYPETTCKRVIELYREMKQRGLRYGRSYELPTLGALALLEVNTKELIQEIAEVEEFLSKQKGFGIWGVGAKQRLMYATMLILSDYMQENETGIMQSSLINGVISLVVAQQAAMCAVIAGSSAAAASSASS